MIRLIGYEIKKAMAGGRVWFLLVGVICFHALLGITIAKTLDEGVVDRKERREEVRQRIVSGEVSREDLERETNFLQNLLSVYYREQTGREEDLLEFEMEHPGILEAYRAYRSSHTEKDLMLTAEAFRDWTEQWEYFDTYADFLNEIQERAEKSKTISIWSDPDSYSYRNIQKTAEDFAGLNSHLELGASEGVEMLGQCFWTDWILILFALFLSIGIFKWEKENRAYALIQSCRYGRWKTGAAKVAAVFLLETALYGVLYAENGMIAQALYGFGPLERSIQSLEAFQNCGISCSVGQYLIAFFIGKWAVILCLTGVICVFMLLASGILLPSAAALFLLLAEYLLRMNIDIHSPVRLFYYINIFGFTDVYELFRSYQNLNIFGYPVNQLDGWMWITFFLLLILPVALIWLSVHFMKNEKKKRSASRSMEASSMEHRIGEAVISWKYRFMPSWILHSRIYWEARNYFIKTGVFLVLILGLGALMVVTAGEADQYGVKKEESSYESWIKQYEGELTDEKRNAIEEWRAYYETLPEQIEEVEHMYEKGEIEKPKRDGKMLMMEYNQSRYEGFPQFYEQYQNLHGQEGIVSAVDFRHLLSENTTRRAAVIMTVGLVVAVSAMGVSREYKRNALLLLRTTAKGRNRLFLQRTVYSVISVWILTGGRFYFQCQTWYEKFQFSAWSIPIQSVPQMGETGISCTILEYMILLAILQCVGMTAVCLFVVSISVLFKQMLKTFVAGTVLFVVPYLLRYVEINPLLYLGLDRILETEQLLWRGGDLTQRGIYLLILLLISIGMWITASRVFRMSDGMFGRKRKRLKRKERQDHMGKG